MPQKRKSTALPVLRPRFRIQCGRKIAFGPGKAELLAGIEKTGSISETARRMGMSYMRAWMLVQEMNQLFNEPVIKAARGGRTHGGAEMTEAGRSALKLYQKMEQDSLKTCQADWRSFQNLLRD